MDFNVVSWEKLQDELYTLSQKIEKSKTKPDLIVAIARGGMVSAQVLSDFLHLPVASFTVKSYKDLQQKSEPKITFKLGEKLHNRHILLIDDVSDSGKTFMRGIEYLKELGASHITTAAVYVKPWTSHMPDFYLRSLDEWIIFPYEMRETIESLKTMWVEEGLKKDEIAEKLLNLDFPEELIERYV